FSPRPSGRRWTGCRKLSCCTRRADRPESQGWPPEGPASWAWRTKGISSLEGLLPTVANLQQRPFSIKMFVPDGDPDGLRIVEKSNWTGVGIVFNRTNYKEVVGRTEFNKTGVYVLVGSSEGSVLPTIYLGEGDPVKDRLNQQH